MIVDICSNEATALATKYQPLTSAVTPNMSTQDSNKGDSDEDSIGFKQALFARDRHRCTQCYAGETEVIFDPDHNVPRGAGGSNRMSNMNTLCRRCHDAKHGEGLAPCAQIASSGRMTDREFLWYKHLVKHMIPAMAEKHGVNLDTRHSLNGNLSNDTSWYVPLGDLIKLDRMLVEDDEVSNYTSLQPEQNT